VRATLVLPPGVAPAYLDAMHGLCLDCHRREEARAETGTPYLGLCTTCHRHRFDDREALLARVRTVTAGGEAARSGRFATKGLNP
jgi:hypothetical protein